MSHDRVTHFTRNASTGRRHRRLAGLAACAASLPIFFAAVSPAAATNGTRGPGEPPVCSTGTVRWTGQAPLSRSGSQRFVVPGITFGAGTVTVTQLVTWDGYAGRSATDPATQHNEQVRLEFFKGNDWVGTSITSEDLADQVESFWWMGNLGSVNLSDGADRVEVVHSSAFEDDGQSNGLSVTGVCLQYNPSVPPTTVPPTTAPPTTVPPTTVPPTTVPPTTVPPTTQPPTTVPVTTVPVATVAPTTSAPPTPPSTVGAFDEPKPTIAVLGVNQVPADRQQLAYTGRRSVIEVIAGALLLAFGVKLVCSSRRRLAPS